MVNFATYTRVYTVLLVQTRRNVPEWKAAVTASSLQLSLRNRVPSEVQFPVETAPRHVGAGDVLERLVTNHVNDWRHYGMPAHTMERPHKWIDRSYIVLHLLFLHPVATL